MRSQIYFWIKDHIVKPMHCRADPTWHQCSETGTIDHDMVYQTFTVEYDQTAVGPYASCNPDENATDPGTAPWICHCWNPLGGCVGFGEEQIDHFHHHTQFPGDPGPYLAAKLAPGVWVSTTHDTECGGARANASLPCTWGKFPGKIVNASCANGNLVAVASAAAGGAVEACEKAQGSKCDFLHAAQTNLSNCCINALIAGVNATDRQALLTPFVQSFISDDPAEGGCKPLKPAPSRLPRRR